jgi:hypothetical protein
MILFVNAPRVIVLFFAILGDGDMQSEGEKNTRRGLSYGFFFKYLVF